MHKLIELREMLMDELEQITDRGQITEGSLGIVDKLTHSIKSIDTIIAMESESRESRDGYSGRRYRDGGSRESRDGYSGRRYRDGGSRESRDGYSAGYDDGGRSGRRRDSMGRFADGGTSGRRGYSRDEAKDMMIADLEGMMGEVSPETQHAIQKAVKALEQE